MDLFIWLWILISLAIYVRMKRIEKKLTKVEGDKFWLESEIEQLKHWCAYDSPEIGFAMLHLQNPKNDVSGFRDKLRNGEFTFTNFKPRSNIKQITNK